MKAQERIAYLEAENKTLREQVSQLQDRLAELEGRLAHNSRNSHRPPAGDGLAHKRYRRRVPSEKRSGGRRKQTPAKHLLDDVLRRAEQILGFLDDLALPFTTNQAERDLRLVKVQQKISGTFRSEAGLTAFCHIRSYLSTMRKQGHAMLVALAAVFAGHPLPVAWGS